MPAIDRLGKYGGDRREVHTVMREPHIGNIGTPALGTAQDWRVLSQIGIVRKAVEFVYEVVFLMLHVWLIIQVGNHVYGLRMASSRA